MAGTRGHNLPTVALSHSHTRWVLSIMAASKRDTQTKQSHQADRRPSTRSIKSKRLSRVSLGAWVCGAVLGSFVRLLVAWLLGCVGISLVAAAIV